MLGLIIALFVFVSVTNAIIYDFNEAGWYASTGENTFPGLAWDVSYSGGSYTMDCWGLAGVCYQINGPWLQINDGTSSGSPATGVGIYRY